MFAKLLLWLIMRKVKEIVLILHNIRSTHNVGSLFRTADGIGVKEIILSGYTPYPTIEGDPRLPHISRKITDQIHKTALGAEESVPFVHHDVLNIELLKRSGYQLVGLEQDSRSIMLSDFVPRNKIALFLGEEVEGLNDELRSTCDVLVEIPMKGKKESFNVSVAAGIALYSLMYEH